LQTSVPVILETFTFLDRNAARDVALAWKGSLKTVPHLKVLPSTAKDLELAWAYFERPDQHNFDPLPVVLAGGASGGLKGGRHLRHAPHTPMSNLLLAMLHKMGARVDAIGDSTEPLTL
jgi:hypothetical protein